MTRRPRRALAPALALAMLLAAAPAGAQTTLPAKRDFDSRAGQPTRPAAPTQPAAIAARARLNVQLGRHGVVDIDPRTGTPRTLARLDGFLTGPSGDDPADIALGYVQAQRPVFGLSEDDLGALRLAKRETDVHGITHLLWAQTWRGISAWDNDLRAAVAADGRLINVGGSPVPGLASRTNDPDLTASEALFEALEDVNRPGLSPRATSRTGPDERTNFTGGHSARLVLFTERRGDVHLAWLVNDDPSPAEAYAHLIDARSGDVLARHSRVDALPSSVSAFDNAPDRSSQAPRPVDVTNTSDLAGPNAFVFRNPDGDNSADNGTTPANASGNTIWDDPFVDFCGTGNCSWDPGTGGSWTTNQRQNAANVYYFVNEFHDWLKDEVGFAGFEGADRVRARVLDGAATGDNNLPDDDHVSNAFMATEPEGTSPVMAMFLWHNGRNGGDDASVVYHEYTHGLSNRLITRSDGYGALNARQSRGMGEGWSDWYALDHLVQNGLETDDPATDGEIAVGQYAEDDETGVRDEATDCPVASAEPTCAAARGTYGDALGLSEHDDGEIWAQTLWQLRDQIGGALARDVITEAMRLSPVDPSFLDMRNAILQADQALNGGANRTAIWQVFADRGMGFTAFSSGGDDRTPTESFVAAPPPGGGLTVSGKVTDAATGAPVAGALVEFTGVPGVGADTTDANGNYAIPGLAAGTYPELAISAPGREIVTRSATVAAPSTVVNQKLRRNLAASSAGATVAAASAPDFTADGCGPGGLIDGSRRTGWGSTSPGHPLAPGAKSVTVALRATSDITAFRVDPGAVCGDDDGASTRGYRIEVSTDGSAFSVARTGTFAAGDNHRLNELTTDRRGIRYVRFVALSPQSAGGSGANFLDAAELEVIGTPTRPVVAPRPVVPPPPAPDLTAPIGRLELRPRQRVRTVLRRGLKISVECNEGCGGPLRATIGGRTAKRVKLIGRRSKRRSVTVATGRIGLGDGRRTALLRFPSKARKRLRNVRRLKLTLTGTLADATGNAAPIRATMTLRR